MTVQRRTADAPWTGDRIALLRMDAGITWTGLDILLGVARPTGYRCAGWENGAGKPSRVFVDRLRRIDAAMDVDPGAPLVALGILEASGIDAAYSYLDDVAVRGTMAARRS